MKNEKLKNEKPAEVPHAVPASPNWNQELNNALAWLSQRAWALGGVLLFTATVYLHNYITVEKIPLSITSSAAIAALPTTFALALFVAVLIAALLLIPTVLLFTPAEKGGRSLAELVHADAAQDRLRWLGVVWRWTFSTALVGTLLWAIIYINAVADVSSPWDWMLSIALFLLSVPIFPALAYRVINVPSIRSITFEYWLMCVGAGAIQLLLLVMVMQIAVSSVGKRIDSFLVFLPLFVLAAAVLAVSQLTGAVLVQAFRRHRQPLALVSGVVAFVIACLGLIAPASAKLVAYAVQATASGGRGCVTLLFAPGASGKYKAPGFNNGDGKSEALHILFDAGDALHVRLVEDREKGSPVYWVSRGDMAGIDVCSASKSP